MRNPTLADDDVATDDDTDGTSTFGDRLVLAREASGLDQAQVANRMGVRVLTLRAWEEDRADLRANRLQMLAGMLNVSMVWLMSGQGTAPSARPASAAAEACMNDLRSVRTEHVRLARRLERLEERLRAALA